MSKPFEILTTAEIEELSWRGRALLKRCGDFRVVVGRVQIEAFTGNDYDNVYDDDDPYMGIYWTGPDGRISDCHIENNHGHLQTGGEEFAARRALRVLRSHMVLDDLARA